MRPECVAVIGPGRVGLSVARAVLARGGAVAVLDRTARDMRVFDYPVTTVWEPALAGADVVIVAVPDDAIATVANALARSGAIRAGHVVLHTSGLHDRSALAALEATGAALGSWHPLQTFTNREGDPGVLTSAPVVIEGDGRALIAGRALAEWLGAALVVEMPADRKASYHAAAVFASNYVVVLADIATRLASEATDVAVPPGLFLPLMRQTVADLAAGPAAALTGPIRRGDAGTVERHLAALKGPERALYLVLAREALLLARRAGLDQRLADAVERLIY